MWMRVPETIDKVLWEGPLELATAEAERRFLQERGGRGARPDPRDLPVVSIGWPEVWPLPEVYPPQAMPPAMRASLERDDFYLVLLKCSFRPREGIPIIWARFMVHLHADASGRQPLAFDLYPLLIAQEVKRERKVTLAPTLKFAEVEGEAGSLAFGIQYAELKPIVSAAGAGEETASWDYQAPEGVHMQGSRFMHLLIKAPKGMPCGRASLDLTADVQLHDKIFPFLTFRQREDVQTPLDIALWGQ